MSLPSEKRYEFVPTASIIAFIVLGVIFLLGLIGRCYALNHSTIRNAQSSDLMIYSLPPKVNLPQQKIRSLTDLRPELAGTPITPVPIQRGPKNL